MNETQLGSTIALRIRKLLALAEGNTNEHERDAAMKLAMDLLSKHNLDLSAIGGLCNESEVLECAVQLKLEPWIRAVLQAACKLYYTRFYMRPVYRGYFADRKEWHPTFVGTEQNIGVTIEVASWLMNSIRLESNWLYTEPYERRSFRLGAAHKLYERACTMIDEEKSAGICSGSTELMVLRNALESANENHLAKMNLGQFQSRGSYYDDAAYGQGEAFGDSVNLGRKSKVKQITMR